MPDYAPRVPGKLRRIGRQVIHLFKRQPFAQQPKPTRTESTPIRPPKYPEGYFKETIVLTMPPNPRVETPITGEQPTPAFKPLPEVVVPTSPEVPHTQERAVPLSVPSFQTEVAPPEAIIEPHVSVPDATIHAMRIADAHEIRYYNADGEEVGLAAHYSSKKAADNAHSILASIYLEEGEGKYDADDIRRLTGRQRNVTSVALKKLAHHAPEGVISYNAEEASLSLGNLALSSRLTTSQEVGSDRNASERHRPIRQPRRTPQERLHALQVGDTLKTDLTESDHALVTTSAHRFALPLETTHAILAARTLAALSRTKRTAVTASNLAPLVWRAMPTSERLLFTSDTDSLVDTTGTVVQGNILHVLRNLTSRMGITREPTGQGTFTLLTPDLNVTYNDAPPAAEDIKQRHIAAVFPPGTTRERIHDYIDGVVPEQLNEIATELIGIIRARDRHTNKLAEINQEQALRYLDFLTDPKGKIAIRDMLLASSSKAKPAKVIGTIRRSLIKPTLGSGYHSALRQRTIAGNHKTGQGRGIRQISGELPQTTKWHVGLRYEKRGDYPTTPSEIDQD